MGMNTYCCLIGDNYYNILVIMSNTSYKFKETQDQRWGIYLQDRLLATVGSYETCQSIGKSLEKNLSHTDSIKAAIAYKKSINRSLIIS